MGKAVFIIGNGFDLSSGLESGYVNFLDKYDLENKNGFCRWLKYKKQIEGNGNWVDFEQEILNVSNMVEKFFSDFPTYHGFEVVGKAHYELFRYIFDFNVDVSAHNKLQFNGNDKISFNDKYYVDSSLNKAMVCKSVIRSIETVLQAFTLFLKEESKKFVINEQFKELFDSYEVKHFINFNFTNTLEEYGIDKENITYVHGTLENPIWGHNGLSSYRFKEYNKINQRRYNLYKNNFAKLVNLKTRSKYEGGLPLDRKQINLDIIVLGHSVDYNDMKIYDQLLNSTYDDINNLIIYNYKNDAQLKLFNLFEHLKDLEVKLENMIDEGRIVFEPILYKIV